MSYENLLSGLAINNLIPTPTPSLDTPTNTNIPDNPFLSKPAPVPTPTPQYVEKIVDEHEVPKLFSVEHFKAKLKAKSHKKNKGYQDASQNISAYDIFSCLRIPYFRIKSFPLEDYSNAWLPIELRSTLGSAAHEFLQDVPGVFTETEVCLKVPSLKVSMRLDGLINHNVLVEIKTCGYTDYEKILKSNKPRVKDFYQTMVYKYMLENHLDELNTQAPTRNGCLPSLEKYNIDTIQFVYVCHELVSAEANSFEEALEMSKVLKRQMNSQRNPFWFIKTLTIDLNKVDSNPYNSYITDKLAVINHHLNNDVIPPLDNKYIDKKDCYFCLYSKICSNH